MQTHSFRKISINNNINYIYCMQKLKKVFMLMIQSKSLNTWLVVYLKSMVINILYIKKKLKKILKGVFIESRGEKRKRFYQNVFLGLSRFSSYLQTIELN